MLGVVTADSQERTVFSSYRMFFAYGGSFLALALFEPLCTLFTPPFVGTDSAARIAPKPGAGKRPRPSSECSAPCSSSFASA